MLKLLLSECPRWTCADRVSRAIGIALTICCWLAPTVASAQNQVWLDQVGVTRVNDVITALQYDLRMSFTDPTVGGGLEFVFNPAAVALTGVTMDANLGDDPDFRCPGSVAITCPANPNFISFGSTTGLAGSRRIATLDFDVLADIPGTIQLTIGSPFGEIGGGSLPVTATGAFLSLKLVPGLDDRALGLLIALLTLASLWLIGRGRGGRSVGILRSFGPVLLLLTLAASPARAVDTDGDTVDDTIDNCLLVANANQRDSNGDGFGNICDGDLNDDGINGDALDFVELKNAFFSAGPHADFDGDGDVNFLDLGRFLNLEVSTPFIDLLPDDTGSSAVWVSGYAKPNQIVELTRNGLLHDSMITGSDGSYGMIANLNTGFNNLQVRTTDGNFTSSSTPTHLINYDPNFNRDFSDYSFTGVTFFTPGGGIPYTINGTSTVEAGARLIIQNGTFVEFGPGGHLVVEGELNSQGVGPNHVIIGSTNLTPGAGDSLGITFTAGSIGNVEYTELRYTTNAIWVEPGGDVDVNQSTITEFSERGIFVGRGGSADITNNLIENVTHSSMSCIEIRMMDGVVTIDNNDIRRCREGIYIRRASPPITNNLIELHTEEGIEFWYNSSPLVDTNVIQDNFWGAQFHGGGGYWGDPAPNFINNIVQNNAEYNLKSNPLYSWADEANTAVDVENNYWGTTNASAIGTTMGDRKLDLDLPTFDFVPFTDASLVPVPQGNLLNGIVSSSIILPMNTTYQVVGTYSIAPTHTLTIEEGVTLQMGSQSSIEVDGLILSQGVVANPVTMTSVAGSPARGDWMGIDVNPDSLGVSFDYTLIEHADIGVYSAGPGSIGLTNSTIREFSDAGIRVTGTAGGNANFSLIDNSGGATAGTGIDIDDTGTLYSLFTTEVRGLSTGVLARGAATATIIDSEIWGNDVGVNTRRELAQQPGLSILNSRLHTNSIYNVDTGPTGWLTPESVVHFAESNYWGSTDLGTVAASIFDRLDDLDFPFVDFVPFVDASMVEVPLNTNLVGDVTDATPLIAFTTYTVTGNIVVPIGQTLTVPEGVTMQFSPDSALVVDGLLQVQGTLANPVTMTSSQGTPARADWDGILINNTSSGATFDYLVIEYVDRGFEVITPATATISNVTIREFTDRGISAENDASVTVTNCLIDNTGGAVDGDGIYTRRSTAATSIQNSEMRGLTNGIRLVGVSSANISGNEIWSNNVGMLLERFCCPQTEPDPVVTNNRLHTNSLYNVSTGILTWLDPLGTTIDMTGNYWGSVDAQTIAGAILDQAEDKDNPFIDFLPFNDAVGTPVPIGNLLLGPLEDSAPLVASTTYEMVPPVFVPPGTTLTVPAGVTMQFGAGASFLVAGTLLVQGTSPNPVTFTSVQPIPARDDWLGIIINPTSTGTVIDWGVIEYVAKGVTNDGPGSFTISNSTIREFQDHGIDLTGAAGALVDACSIDNTGTGLDGEGIEIEDVTGVVTIQNSDIQGVHNGIYLRGLSSATITGNELWNNDNGIHMRADGGGEPSASISNNRIHLNNQRNLTLGTSFWATPELTTIVAENNYWGSPDPSTISTTIFDRLDDLDDPLVDYVPFLDNAMTPVALGSTLVGVVNDATPLVANTTYQVGAEIIVPATTTLTMPQGVTLEFAAGTSLVVDGDLQVQGVNGNIATFTSISLTPARGDWQGIVVNPPSTGASFDYALIEYAVQGIEVLDPASATVTNSTIREFSSGGFSAIDGSSASISNSLVDNTAGSQQGDGIEFENVTGVATIQNNEVRGAAKGLNLVGTSTATVTGNEIWSNNQGLVLARDCCPQTEPAPSVTDNQLHTNTTYNLSTGTLPWAAPFDTTVVLENNYWGSVDPQVIAASIFDLGDDLDQPFVDFIPFDDAVGTPVATPNVIFGPYSDPNPLVSGTTYEVVSPFFVRDNTTLTIPNNITFQMGSGSSLAVEGTLYVQGTLGNEVTFTSIQGTPARGDWQGIVILGDNHDSIIDYALIEYMFRGVEIVDPSGATISNSTIREWDDNGVRLTDVSSSPGGAWSVMLSNVFDDYDGGVGVKRGTGVYLQGPTAGVLVQFNTIRGANNGIFASRSSPHIHDNIIEFNRDDAIEIQWASTAEILRNDIHDNDGGVRLMGGGVTFGEPAPWIRDNFFYNHTAFVIEFANSWPTVTTFDARWNYWGTVDELVIPTLIWDQVDDPAYPLLDFTPFDDQNGDQYP